MAAAPSEKSGATPVGMTPDGEDRFSPARKADVSRLDGRMPGFGTAWSMRNCAGTRPVYGRQVALGGGKISKSVWLSEPEVSTGDASVT